MSIIHIDRLPDGSVETYTKGLSTKFLGRACGSRNLYVNIDTLPPGTFSAKYHSHTLQEEFFLVLSGSGTLRMNGKNYEVSKGDMISKPSKAQDAHQFYNTGDVPMEILDVGTVEPGDVCVYPEENVVLLRSSRLSFKKDDCLADWDSDPNV